MGAAPLSTSHHSLKVSIIEVPHLPAPCLQLPAAPERTHTMAKMVWCFMVVALVGAMAGGASAASCNTNGASPTQGDANEAVQYIRNLGNSQCCQQNCGGDFCTVMFQNGGARVLICGDCNKCTTCSTAGGALNNVLAQCTRNVGGTARCSGNENAAGFAFVIDIARRVTNGIGAPIDIAIKTNA